MGKKKIGLPGGPNEMITDPKGQWDHPGKNTRIEGNQITMQGVEYPVWAQPNVGPGMMMMPGEEHYFQNAEYVDEYPMMQGGGAVTLLKALLKSASKNTNKIKNIANYYLDDFASEIDWSTVNKDILNNKSLLGEYKAIEKASKADGSWMKYSDGSTFDGTPAQFVQMRSNNFIDYAGGTTDQAEQVFKNKVYRGTGQDNADYTSPVGLHGNQSRETKAVFTTDNPEVALSYKNYNIGSRPKDSGVIQELGYPQTNIPIKLADAQGNNWRMINYDPNLGDDGFQRAVDNNNLLDKFLRDDALTGDIPDLSRLYLNADDYANYLMNNPNAESMAKIFNVKDGLKTAKDVIGTNVLFNPHKVPLKSLKRNDGMFNINNPNIFKAAIPGAVAAFTKEELEADGYLPTEQDGGQNLTTQLRNFQYDKKRNKPFAQYGLENKYPLPYRDGVRLNYDEEGNVIGESSHIMRTETLDGKNWFSFPTLFQDKDGTWIDMSKEKNWMPAFEEAKVRGEIIEFGDDKEAAIKFGEGSWKKMQEGGGVFEEGVEQYKWFKNYLQSPKYVERLKKEFPDYTNEQIGEEIKTRLENVMQTRVGFLPRSSDISTGVGGVQGVYNADEYPGAIMLRPEYSASTSDVLFEPGNYLSGYDTIPLHEWSHAADDGGNRIPQSTTDFMLSRMKENSLDIPKDQYYYTRPTEYLGRMQPLRYLMEQEGLYDAGMEDFTIEDLEKARKNKRIKNNVHFENLMDNVNSDEEFIELMNSVAAIDTIEEDNTMMAEGGIEIPMLQKDNIMSVLTNDIKKDLEEGNPTFLYGTTNDQITKNDIERIKQYIKTKGLNMKHYFDAYIKGDEIKRKEIENYRKKNPDTGIDRSLMRLVGRYAPMLSSLEAGRGSSLIDPETGIHQLTGEKVDMNFKKGGSVSWNWKGKSYSGTLIPSMENEKNRYARTKNGKIKTLPKRQDGGDLIGQDQKDFLKNWLTSPMGQNLLSKSLNQNEKLINDRTFKRNRELDEVEIESTDSEGKFRGTYTPGRHRILIDNDFANAEDQSFGMGLEDVLVHELSHSQDFGGKNSEFKKSTIPLADEKLIKKLTKNNKKRVMDDPELSMSSQKFNYLSKPTEVRARLNAIRYGYENDNLRKGLPSIFESEVTPEMQELMQSNSQYKQLQEIYTEDEINQLLNTISFQDNDRSMDKFIYARYGSEIPKAQMGLVRNLIKKGGPKIMKYIDNLLGKTDDVVEAAAPVVKQSAASKMKGLYEMLPIKQLEYPTHYGNVNIDDGTVQNALDILKAQGKYADDIGYKIEDLVGENIQYLGNQGGRTIVNVPLPNGKSQMFYKSTDLAGKGTEGLWQPYAGHARVLDFPSKDGPFVNENWFIKDGGFKDFYNSQSFRDIAGNLDRIAAEQGWDMSEQILKSKLEYGGDLPKAQRGLIKEIIKSGAKYVDDIIPTIRNYFKNADKFTSKIDWGKWNKEIPNNKALMEEYNAIEKLGKENGTWMKNPDGSIFRGEPEQWVQQQSSNFKAAFGETKLLNPDGSPMVLYHGSPKKFDKFDESMFQLGDSGYSGSGIYTTPSKVTAESYTISGRRFHDGKIEPTLYQLYGRGNNPITSKQLIDNSGGDIGFAKVGEVIDKNLPTSLFNFHRKGAPKIDQLLDYDVAINNQRRGITNIKPINDSWEIVFPTNKQLKSSIGNNGMFDMTDPNIYKQEGGEEREEFIAPFSKEDWEYYRSKFPRIPYPPPGITPTPEPESEPEPVVPSTSGITPELLFSQAWVESKLDPLTKNKKGYMGLGQIGKGVIEDYKKANKVSELDPFNPQDNYNVQNWYMNNIYNSEWVDKPNQSDNVRLAKTLAGYSLGPTKARRYFTKFREDGKDIYNSFEWLDDLPDETSKYIKMILQGESTEKRPRVQEFIKDAMTNDKYKSIKDLYFKRSGGESKIYKVYKDYINGNATDKNSEMVYDKLNRIHYKDAKQAGMGVPNYIMSYLVGNS